MNVVFEDITDLDGNRLEEDVESYLIGAPAYIPEIVFGQPMRIMNRNARYTYCKTKPVVQAAIIESEHRHTIYTADSIYRFRQVDTSPTKRKRITSTLYMESKISRFPRVIEDPEGHLFSMGRYPTKIFASELPPWYVYGYMYKRHGYMSAKGVKYLLYKPNYIFDSLCKYDMLFISYDQPIKEEKDPDIKRYHWYTGYKHVLDGGIIKDFIIAAHEYSGIEVSDMLAELEKKRDWYYDKHPDLKRT